MTRSLAPLWRVLAAIALCRCGPGPERSPVEVEGTLQGHDDLPLRSCIQVWTSGLGVFTVQSRAAMFLDCGLQVGTVGVLTVEDGEVTHVRVSRDLALARE